MFQERPYKLKNKKVGNKTIKIVDIADDSKTGCGHCIHSKYGCGYCIHSDSNNNPEEFSQTCQICKERNKNNEPIHE